MNYEKEKIRKQSHLQFQQQQKNKVPSNKFNKETKELHFENYRALRKETEEDTNKRKHILCSGIGKIASLEMSALPEAVYRFNATHRTGTNTSGISHRTRTNIPKMYTELQNNLNSHSNIKKELSWRYHTT